ncbi:hypothetical protein GE09DRAFT_1234120 [Coniochaeta sp. 2T2.1]|nr:hypothetical protein GE09DRAFT_1234120 [Coniochaeta sp. 2T2.1]
MESARKNPGDVSVLKSCMGSHPDIVHGCLFPETDVDIIVSIVLRFISSLQRDTILARLQNTERLAWRTKLVVDLVGGFKLFRKDKEYVPFCISCQDTVIEPAFRLHEKLLTSTHHFYIDTNPYIVWNQQRGLETNPEFFANLDNLQCENILQNRKHFDVTKLDPPPTFEELKDNLTNVLTVVPGLYIRQIGKGDAIKLPVVVRKQQVLVVFGGQEKRDRFLGKGHRTLMNYIYFGQKEKEKEKEESRLGAWAKMTWG